MPVSPDGVVVAGRVSAGCDCALRVWAEAGTEVAPSAIDKSILLADTFIVRHRSVLRHQYKSRICSRQTTVDFRPVTRRLRAFRRLLRGAYVFGRCTQRRWWT